MFHVAIAFALFFSAVPVDDVTVDVDVSHDPAAVALDKGDPAPYAGILLTSGRAAKLGTSYEKCKTKMKLDEEFFTSREKIREDAAKNILDIERETAAEERKLLEKRLADAEARAWWDSADVLVPVGVVIGIGATVGAVFLVAQLRPSLPR